jgi:hypothetical protein
VLRNCVRAKLRRHRRPNLIANVTLPPNSYTTQSARKLWSTSAPAIVQQLLEKVEFGSGDLSELLALRYGSTGVDGGTPTASRTADNMTAVQAAACWFVNTTSGWLQWIPKSTPAPTLTTSVAVMAVVVPATMSSHMSLQLGAILGIIFGILGALIIVLAIVFAVVVRRRGATRDIEANAAGGNGKAAAAAGAASSGGDAAVADGSGWVSVWCAMRRSRLTSRTSAHQLRRHRDRHEDRLGRIRRRVSRALARHRRRREEAVQVGSQQRVCAGGVVDVQAPPSARHSVHGRVRRRAESVHRDGVHAQRISVRGAAERRRHARLGLEDALRRRRGERAHVPARVRAVDFAR